eukprot:TRINITY_DN36700_c0_g2_i2.p1 TRINITY_DN36700_c0_g2~~TRINITY_DN36700_c0_g2_i2.p1  ORF type:complete len:114 (-),score=4.24 TRINITY_DN36700_c0_g2_i2:780-1121(-)
MPCTHFSNPSNCTSCESSLSSLGPFCQSLGVPLFHHISTSSPPHSLFSLSVFHFSTIFPHHSHLIPSIPELERVYVCLWKRRMRNSLFLENYMDHDQRTIIFFRNKLRSEVCQ